MATRSLNASESPSAASSLAGLAAVGEASRWGRLYLWNTVERKEEEVVVVVVVVVDQEEEKEDQTSWREKVMQGMSFLFLP